MEALGQLQRNLRARVTGVEAEVQLYPPCTGGRPLPWLGNQEGRLQQSAMSPTANARFVMYLQSRMKGPTSLVGYASYSLTNI